MPNNLVDSKPNLVFVSLISIPLSDIQAQFTNENKLFSPLSMPMGILYLSACLKKAGACSNISIIDFPLHINEITQYSSIEQFIDEVAEKSTPHAPPDIIAISLMFASSYQFYKLCIARLHDKFPSAKIIVGGYQGTNACRFILEDSPADYVLRGEGEQALPEFVSSIAQNLPITILGIYSRETVKDNKVLKCCEMVDVTAIPFPDWDLIDMRIYTHHPGRRKALGSDSNDTVATLITSRGCPFQCTFCSAHTVHGKKMRLRSIENVIAEMQQLSERYGVNLFMPEDDIFNLDKRRTIELLYRMKLWFPDMKIQLPDGLHVNSLDNEVIDALVDAGLVVFNLAVESGSPYVLKHLMKKNVNLDHLRDIVTHLRTKPNVYVRVFIVLGLPHETKEMMQETVDFIKTLGVDWAIFMTATPLIGSEIHREFVQMGCISDDICALAESHFVFRFFDTPEISAKDLNEFVYRANLDVNFIHNFNLQSGRYDRAIAQFTDIIQNYPFHIFAYDGIRRAYRAIGNKELAVNIEDKLKDLLKNDNRAKEMYIKYQDLLMPGGTS